MPTYFAYTFPEKTYTENKLDDPEMQHCMKVEASRAMETLEKMLEER